jgi:transposase IS116/IS110/IS902 family protein
VERYIDTGRVVVDQPLFNEDDKRRRIVITLNMSKIVQHIWEAIRFENALTREPVFDRERPASSGGCRRLGHITKQGNTLLRFLLVEAFQATVRCELEWRRRFMHLALRRDRRIATVAMARKLAVRMYWMWRKGCDYPQLLKFGSHVGQLETGNGAQ